MANINDIIKETTKRHTITEESKKPELDGFALDKLKDNVKAAAKKLQDALRTLKGTEQYIGDCHKIYEYINKMRTGHELLSGGKIEEDIKVTKDIDPNDLKDIATAAKRVGVDVAVMKENVIKEISTGKYKYWAEFTVRIYAKDINEAQSKAKWFLDHSNEEHPTINTVMTNNLVQVGKITSSDDYPFQFKISVTIYSPEEGNQHELAQELCDHFNQTHADSYQCKVTYVSDAPKIVSEGVIKEEVNIPPTIQALADKGTEVKKIMIPTKTKRGYILTRNGKEMKIMPKDKGYEVTHDGKIINLNGISSAKDLNESTKPKHEIIKEISAVDFKKQIKL